LQPEDAVTLLQVSLVEQALINFGEQEHHADWITGTGLAMYEEPLNLLLKAKRYSLRYFDFPLEIACEGGPCHFAGSASLLLDILGMHVHCYDIAMYLNNNNKEWTALRGRSHEESIDAMLGQVQFNIVIKTQWANNKFMAGAAEMLGPFLKVLGAQNARKDLRKYKDLYLRAPKVGEGSKVVLLPLETGVRAFIAGKDMGLAESSFLGPALLQTYLGPNSTLPEFRDRVFTTLSQGMPGDVSEPAQSTTLVHTPWWMWLILATAILAFLGLCAGSVYCCWRCLGSAAAPSK